MQLQHRRCCARGGSPQSSCKGASGHDGRSPYLCVVPTVPTEKALEVKNITNVP